MALTSMSVIMTVLVLNLHHRGPNKRAVPVWLKDILVNKLSPYLCLQESVSHPTCYYNSEERFIKNMSLKITLDNIQQALENEMNMDNRQNLNSSLIKESNSSPIGTVHSSRRRDSLLNKVNVNQNQIEKISNHTETSNSSARTATPQYQYSFHDATNEFIPQQSQHIYPRIIDRTYSPPHQPSAGKHEKDKRPKRRHNSTLSKTNEEILNSLKRILEKHEKEDRDYEVVQEWRRVAQCVDRILFFIFLIATFTSTVGILVIAPVTQ